MSTLRDGQYWLSKVGDALVHIVEYMALYRYGTVPDVDERASDARMGLVEAAHRFKPQPGKGMEEQYRRDQSSRRTNSLCAILALGDSPEEEPSQTNDTMGGQQKEGVPAKRVFEALEQTAQDAGGLHAPGPSLTVILLMVSSTHYRTGSRCK